MDNVSSLTILLDDLIVQMEILIQLSQVERTAFENNDLSQIQQNNTQRTTIQKKISELIDALISHQAVVPLANKGTFLDNILSFASSLEAVNATIIQTSVQQLKDLILDYINVANVNRSILNVNLHRAKEFFNILTQNKNLLDVSIYNQSGLLEAD